MIPSAKCVSDFIQGRFRMTTGEVHRDLAWKRDVGRPALTRHIRKADIKMLGDLLLDLIDGDNLLRFLLQNIPQELLHSVARNLAAAQGNEGGDSHQCPFQTPDIRPNALRQKLKDLLTKLDMQDLRLLPQNRHPGLDIWRLQFGGEAPFKTRY